MVHAAASRYIAAQMVEKEKSGLREEVLGVRSKAQVNRFIRWIGTDKKRYGLLMEFFLGGEELLARKAAWIIGHCTEKHPRLASPWLEKMTAKIKQPGVHGALKRNAVRILQFTEIPDRLKGSVTNLCFDLLSSPKEDIAVRTFSITVIANIAKEEPELQKELGIVVEQMLPYTTPAFRARARKVLKSRKIEEVSKVSYEDWLNGK
jgi:hypothetical protein